MRHGGRLMKRNEVRTGLAIRGAGRQAEAAGRRPCRGVEARAMQVDRTRRAGGGWRVAARSAGRPAALAAEPLECRVLLSGSTYYVSPGGSDAAAGTSDGAAWKTLQKAA